MVAVFADCGLKDGLFYMINQVPIVFLSLLLFSIFLFSQTFLITCPSISKRIKLDYGDSFLKKKGYNSALTSSKLAAQFSKTITAGALGGLLFGTLVNVYGEAQYSANYDRYLNAQVANPGIQLNPPERGWDFILGLGSRF